MSMNRRNAIKTLGALAGAAGLPRVLTGCGGDGEAPGIDTFVFMMMENRSYDHYLGHRALDGRGGRGFPADLTLPDLDGARVNVYPADNSIGQQCIPFDPPHSWDASRAQLNGGRNDGFLIEHQRRAGNTNTVEAIQYMTRDQVPVHSALADAYTSCDAWFSSVLGPTLPNRMYWHAGTSNGAKANNEVLGGAFRGVTSIYRRLEDAGLEWAYYYGDVPVLAFLDDVDTSGRLFRMTDFFAHAAAGTLPPVVYIDPNFGANDDHPPHHPLLGQQLIAAAYQALATSPHWERSMMLVTYDEGGGFFDHVAPPAGIADDFADEGFDQLGFRVPSIVAGPYAKAGHVSSVQYDHTSALKHLQDTFALPSLNQRVDAAANLLDCLDLDRLEAGDPAAPIELPPIEIRESELPRACFSHSGELRDHEHDLLAWADTVDLGVLDRREETRDTVFAIADYLDSHNLGRIVRGK